MTKRRTQSELIAHMRSKAERRKEVEDAFADLPDDYWLDSEEAALFLGITMQTLAQRRCRGRSPQYVPGHRTKYQMGDLRRFRDEEAEKLAKATPQQRQADALARVKTAHLRGPAAPAG